MDWGFWGKVGSMAFFAGLGLFDFVTDFIAARTNSVSILFVVSLVHYRCCCCFVSEGVKVLLVKCISAGDAAVYGCFVDNSLTPECPTLEANNTGAVNVTLDLELPECTPHWAWFGIALTLMVLSTLVPAFFWADQRAISFSDGATTGRFMFFCSLGVAQLSQVWDLAQVLREGVLEEDPSHGGAGRRNFATVILESAPQLYLQSYVLFALGAYGQTFKVMSVCSSVLSLAGSAVMAAAKTAASGDRLTRLWPGKVLAVLFLATDAAVRSMGFAMVLCEPVRAYGLPTCITFFLLCTICLCKARDREFCFNALLVPYVVPALVLLQQDKEAYRSSNMEIVLLLRYVETILFGILAGTFGETACGNALTRELGIYFGMLVANALSLVLFQCFVDDDGEFNTPRQSTYSPKQILGRPMERMPDRE